MRRQLVRSALRGLSLAQVRHVTPVGLNAARGCAAQVHRELERDFGVLAPPIAPRHGPGDRDAAAGAVADGSDLGRRSVPEAVRVPLHSELSRWDGRPPGIARAWAEDAIAILSASDRSAGRPVLLTAIASRQVDEAVVARFREQQPEGRALVELTAWASLTAARRAVGRTRIEPTTDAASALPAFGRFDSASPKPLFFTDPFNSRISTIVPMPVHC